jgi:hypothetical protein
MEIADLDRGPIRFAMDSRDASAADSYVPLRKYISRHDGLKQYEGMGWRVPRCC